MKVCMVVANNVVFDNRVRKEAQTLSKNGHEIIVVGMLEPNDKYPLEEKAEGFKIIRVRKDVSLNQGGLGTLFKKILSLPEVLAFGGASISKLGGLVSSIKADVYHAHDLDTLFVCYLASKKNHAKLVYDAHELFVEAMEDSLNEKIKERKFLQWLVLFLIQVNMRLVRRALIKKADKVITVSHSISNHLHEHFNLKEKPVVIMNCWEPGLKPTKKGVLRKLIGLSSEYIIVLYQGGMMRGRGLESLTKSVKKWPDKSVLVFLGSGQLEDELKEIASTEKLNKKVIFLDPVSYKELINYTSSADLGVITLEATNLNNMYALPNKLFEYLAAGIAIICPDFPDMSSIVSQGAGVTFKHDNWDDLAKKITSLIRGNKISQMKKTSRELFASRYNWDLQKRTLQNVYKDLLA